MRLSSCLSSRTAALACAAVFALWGCAGVSPALAKSGPFEGFGGRWSGTGTLRPQGGKPERVRCDATYRPRGSSAHQVDLNLRCTSDSYKFNLSGNFNADRRNQVTGRWTEHTRSIGGTVVGQARGYRLQIHIESSAFAATLNMVTRNRRQTVNIDSRGGGQVVKGSISLRRR
jgi:hypothetical protein